MTNREIAALHRESLSEIGWEVEELKEETDGSVGFLVTMPAAKGRAASRHHRSFAGGAMTVTRGL